MNSNLIFKAGFLIVLLTCMVKTPDQVYADVQSNIVTTEDSYTEENETNTAGGTGVDDIINLENESKRSANLADLEFEDSSAVDSVAADDGKVEKDVETDKEDSVADKENGGRFNWTEAVMVSLLALMCVLGFLNFYKDKRSSKQFRELLDEFDREYNKYKRNYTYCVEEILKKENDDSHKENIGIVAIRENVADIYVKMSEIKKRRDIFSLSNVKAGGESVWSGIKSMKELHKSVQQYGKRLERYLFELREND